jgi:hypothetical protein
MAGSLTVERPFSEPGFDAAGHFADNGGLERLTKTLGQGASSKTVR